MDKQKERSRMDEDNPRDTNTDVSRSQNRQSANEANEGQNVSNDPARAGEGRQGREDGGSHQEGDYDRTGRNP